MRLDLFCCGYLWWQFLTTVLINFLCKSGKFFDKKIMYKLAKKDPASRNYLFIFPNLSAA